jgi:hypothetical protein
MPGKPSGLGEGGTAASVAATGLAGYDVIGAIDDSLATDSMRAPLGAGVFPGRRPRNLSLISDAAAESGWLSIAEAR